MNEQAPTPTVTEPTADPTPSTTEPTADPTPTATEPTADPTPTATEPTATESVEDPKPYLGNTPQDPQDPQGPKGPTSQPPTSQPPTSQPPTEEEYLKGITVDEDVLGKHDGMSFDPSLVKAVIPAFQKHGLSTAAAREIANVFAKQQMENLRIAQKERADQFTELNRAAKAKYSDGDFEQINRAIDQHFKPGGRMNFVVRNSELGADPEFLALMHMLGAAVKEDTAKGVASPGAAAGMNGDTAEGISKIW